MTMAKAIKAIYEGGAFHPLEPVDYAEHQRVTLIVNDSDTRSSNGSAEVQAVSEMPTTGTELIAYWEQAGVIGSRPDITDSVAHARKLRRQAETRQP
jgi:predicted DNA-binding antitoxin AbrB/MazE fold protein